MPPSVTLTDRFEAATRLAIECHQKQVRKATQTPFISHPLTVASIVMEYGGTEDQIIAALLHDTVEDCALELELIHERFGPVVTRIVAECTDCDGPAKRGWKERKQSYLRHLREASEDTLLVSAADKLHNARSLAHDIKHYGIAIWHRFNAPPHEILWYYRSLTEVFKQRCSSTTPWLQTPRLRLGILLLELEAAVRELERLYNEWEEAFPQAMDA